MNDLKHILKTASMLFLLSVSAYALDPQRKGEQKSPPPKEPAVVIKEEKREDKRRNEERRNDRENKGGKGDKKGKP